MIPALAEDRIALAIGVGAFVMIFVAIDTVIDRQGSGARLTVHRFRVRRVVLGVGKIDVPKGAGRVVALEEILKDA